MIVQAVDLAAVAWAQCLCDGSKVMSETSAWYHPTETEAVRVVTAGWHAGFLELSAFIPDLPDALVVEEQPHGVRFDTTAKNVARMQGRIVQALPAKIVRDRLYFVPPALWQRYMGVWRKPEECAAVAKDRYGYEPPDLLKDHADAIPPTGKERQQVRTRLKKLMTDYVDAYLIAQWAHETFEAQGTLDVPSVQRYVR